MTSSNFEPTLPTDVTGLAAMAARLDAEYRNALQEVVVTLETVERVRHALKLCETVPWTSTKEVDGKEVPLIDGKNEQTRDAQFLFWCIGDAMHTEQRAYLVTVLRDHRLAEARVEAARDTLKTIRALLYAIAPEHVR
jgi:hypothetical protein